MCHFWDDVWNLVGFQTTARCTAWAVSLGSRGRCFFTAAGTGDAEETEVEAEEEALVDPLLAVVALAWPDAAVETRLRAAVMVGCKESFRLEAASRDGAAAAADEGTLPTRKENKIAPSEWHSRFNLKLFLKDYFRPPKLSFELRHKSWW